MNKKLVKTASILGLTSLLSLPLTLSACIVNRPEAELNASQVRIVNEAKTIESLKSKTLEELLNIAENKLSEPFVGSVEIQRERWDMYKLIGFAFDKQAYEDVKNIGWSGPDGEQVEYRILIISDQGRINQFAELPFECVILSVRGDKIMTDSTISEFANYTFSFEFNEAGEFVKFSAGLYAYTSEIGGSFPFFEIFTDDGSTYGLMDQREMGVSCLVTGDKSILGDWGELSILDAKTVEKVKELAFLARDKVRNYKK